MIGDDIKHILQSQEIFNDDEKIQIFKKSFDEKEQGTERTFKTYSRILDKEKFGFEDTEIIKPAEGSESETELNDYKQKTANEAATDYHPSSRRALLDSDFLTNENMHDLVSTEFDNVNIRKIIKEHDDILSDEDKIALKKRYDTYKSLKQTLQEAVAGNARNNAYCRKLIMTSKDADMRLAALKTITKTGGRINDKIRNAIMNDDNPAVKAYAKYLGFTNYYNKPFRMKNQNN